MDPGIHKFAVPSRQVQVGKVRQVFIDAFHFLLVPVSRIGYAFSTRYTALPLIVPGLIQPMADSCSSRRRSAPGRKACSRKRLPAGMGSPRPARSCRQGPFAHSGSWARTPGKNGTLVGEIDGRRVGHRILLEKDRDQDDVTKTQPLFERHDFFRRTRIHDLQEVVERQRAGHFGNGDLPGAVDLDGADLLAIVADLGDFWFRWMSRARKSRPACRQWWRCPPWGNRMTILPGALSWIASQGTPRLKRSSGSGPSCACRR